MGSEIQYSCILLRPNVGFEIKVIIYFCYVPKNGLWNLKCWPGKPKTRCIIEILRSLKLALVLLLLVASLDYYGIVGTTGQDCEL